jgi:hypothetical protein
MRPNKRRTNRQALQYVSFDKQQNFQHEANNFLRLRQNLKEKKKKTSLVPRSLLVPQSRVCYVICLVPSGKLFLYSTAGPELNVIHHE